VASTVYLACAVHAGARPVWRSSNWPPRIPRLSATNRSRLPATWRSAVSASPLNRTSSSLGKKASRRSVYILPRNGAVSTTTGPIATSTRISRVGRPEMPGGAAPVRAGTNQTGECHGPLRWFLPDKWSSHDDVRKSRTPRPNGQRREGFFIEQKRGLQDLENTKKARLPQRD
jgi:hypothetical protein